METKERIKKYNSYWKNHLGKLITITTKGGFDHKGIVDCERGVIYLWGKIDYWDLAAYTIQKIKFHPIEEQIIWKLENE